MVVKELKSIHFVGIKGVGMTSLALCAQDLDIKVTGSDLDELFVTDEVLRKRGIKWEKGFSEKNIGKPDLVITTGAHGGLNNIEVLAAKKKGIPILTQAEALAKFSEGKDLISVCGVGGKTSISSMIATIFETAGEKPSYAIGVGEIKPIGYPGKYQKTGKHFICEADEFVASPGIDNTPKFLFLFPKVLVVTNVEHDHPDVYKTLSDTKKAYKKLFKKMPSSGLLIANIDNENTKEVIQGLTVPVQTYGFSKDADWKIEDYKIEKQKSFFTLTNKDGKRYEMSIQVPGRYNVENVVAAFITAKFLGLTDNKIIEGLELFEGTQRRFEKIGVSKSGISIYDDYAHHPDEIIRVLKAAGEWFGKKRLVAIFQPHTYTRTKTLFKQFTESFNNVDMVGFMDIYSSAREKKDKTVSSSLLAKEVKKHNSQSFYTGNHKDTISWIRNNLNSGDILLTLGAGDIFHIHNKVLEL